MLPLLVYITQMYFVLEFAEQDTNRKTFDMRYDKQQSMRDALYNLVLSSPLLPALRIFAEERNNYLTQNERDPNVRLAAKSVLSRLGGVKK